MPTLLRLRRPRQAATPGAPVQEDLRWMLSQYSLADVDKELLRAALKELQHFRVFRYPFSQQQLPHPLRMRVIRL